MRAVITLPSGLALIASIYSLLVTM